MKKKNEWKTDREDGKIAEFDFETLQKRERKKNRAKSRQTRKRNQSLSKKTNSREFFFSTGKEAH